MIARHRTVSLVNVLILALLRVAASVRGGSVVWDASTSGTTNWTDGANWIGGVAPTIADDVQIGGNPSAATLIKFYRSAKSLAISHAGNAGAHLTLQSDYAAPDRMDLESFSLHNDSTGADAVFVIGYNGRKTLAVTNAISVTGGVGTGNTHLSLSTMGGRSGSSVNAPALTLGGDRILAINATLRVHPASAGEVLEINAPEIVFNRGSGMSDPNTWAGTIRLNGNVTLQEGAFAGPVPGIGIGRNVEAQTGTLRIEGSLAQNIGLVNLQGNGVISIGGNWRIGTGARIVITTTAGMAPRLKLGGNLDIAATSVASGHNLNVGKLDLIGVDVQELEAAVTDADKSFQIHTLTLDDSRLSILDQHVNFAAGEYFQTQNLVNSGNSTLMLNGCRFFVGATELVKGHVYTEFGGTLRVPSPATLVSIR